MTRAQFNERFGWLAGILAIVSLAMGIACQSEVEPFCKPYIGMIVIGCWALGPPVFFWVDWVVYFNHGSTDEAVSTAAKGAYRDIAKHTHDLSRNIWLGLLAILYVLFRLKLPGVG